jgi:hypothetical protein
MQDIVICDPCGRKAIRLAVRMAEDFGGSIIDPAKPCGNKREGGGE